MHYVFSAVESQPNGNGVAESGETGAVDGATDDNWEQVGPKNKSIVTHSNVHTMTTPISQIFGGQLRSLLCTNKESATLEPFFTVPLNVQVIPTSSMLCLDTISLPKSYSDLPIVVEWFTMWFFYREILLMRSHAELFSVSRRLLHCVRKLSRLC